MKRRKEGKLVWLEGKFCEVCGTDLANDSEGVRYRIYIDGDPTGGMNPCTTVQAYVCYNPKCLQSWVKREVAELKLFKD